MCCWQHSSLYMDHGTNLPPGMDFRFGNNGNNGNMQTYVAPTDRRALGTPTAIGTYNYTVIVIDSHRLDAAETVSDASAPGPDLDRYPRMAQLARRIPLPCVCWAETGCTYTRPGCRFAPVAPYRPGVLRPGLL